MRFQIVHNGMGGELARREVPRESNPSAALIHVLVEERWALFAGDTIHIEEVEE